MKKHTIPYIIFTVMIIFLISMTSCKRSAPADPNVIANAGFRIILSGTANPSTLYVPETQPATSTVISVRALNNDGTAAAGYTIVFEDYLGYGYFDGYKVSDSRVTDANGNASIVYFIPPGANIKTTVTGQVRATLVDDGRLDNLPLSDVYDTIPVRVIPYLNQGVLIHGHVLTPAGSGVGDVIMSLVGSDGNTSAVTITRTSGSYEFYVPGGWYGSLAAAAEGYTISPESYVWESTNPVISDLDNVDFIAIFEGGNTLGTDITTWDVGVAGDTTTVNVYNTTGDSTIAYTTTPSVPWVHVSPLSGSTPGSFTITVDANDTGADRAGAVTVNATSTADSSVTININQASNEVSGEAVLAADLTSISADGVGADYVVNVYNSGTSDSIDFVVTPNNSWITTDTNSGSTDAQITLTIAANKTGALRSGTVTLTPTTTGVNNTVTISISQGAGPALVPEHSSYTVGSSAAFTLRIYVSASDGSNIDFAVEQGISWLIPVITSDTTPGHLEFTTMLNDTGSTRSGTLVISSSKTQSISVNITQL